MADDSIFSTIANILNPLKIFGYIKGSIDPALSFIDSTLGYDDFELSYGGRPKQDEIKKKKIHVFKINDEIRFLTHDILLTIEQKTNPTPQEKYIYEKGIKLAPEQITLEAYKELVNILDDDKHKIEPSYQTKYSVYNFLNSEKRLNLGYRYYYNRVIAEKYRNFEKGFIKKFPLVVKASNALGNLLGALCTFATSQTGLRIANLASLTAVAIATGGIMPMAMVGLYTFGIGISVIQQANSRMKLNRLEEEANLLQKWIIINKGKKTFNKESLTPAKTFSKPHYVYRWFKAGLMHFSTYLIETGIPLAFSILFPIGGAISGAQKGLLIGISSTSLGVGAISRKAYEDKKLKLKEVVEKIKQRPDVPHYKTIDELRENLNQLIESETQNGKDLYIKKSWVRRYFKALKQVLNPFSPPIDVKDPDKFILNISIATTAATVSAAISSPTLIIPAVTASLVASSAATIVNEVRTKETESSAFEFLRKAIEKDKTGEEQGKNLSKKQNLDENLSFVKKLQKEKEQEKYNNRKFL